uniref:Uncharacterized protein n=1 Tax=Knipowitschia caucasica TaxID=637954 RepID=A0AAV2MI05_KNICA
MKYEWRPAGRGPGRVLGEDSFQNTLRSVSLALHWAQCSGSANRGRAPRAPHRAEIRALTAHPAHPARLQVQHLSHTVPFIVRGLRRTALPTQDSARTQAGQRVKLLHGGQYHEYRH